jgi:thiol-disulfide isomerase/thioredoxin
VKASAALVLLALSSCSEAVPDRIEVISKGSAVRPEEYLHSGYVTILEFTRDGCGTCVELAPELDRLTEKYPKVLLRRVDILRSGSPASEQMSREFAGRDVPHILVFDGTGRALGPVAPEPRSVESAVLKALGR